MLIPIIPEVLSRSEGDISSAAEKGEALEWDGYENEVLPAKTHGRLLRNLRHQIFTLYRRLFGIVLIVNLSIFIATLVRGGINAQQIGLIVVANLFCSILMRQDYIINAFFTVFCSVPASYVECSLIVSGFLSAYKLRVAGHYVSGACVLGFTISEGVGVSLTYRLVSG